jgi:heparosan-N-sulfate-glucuronate 5-epimerase
LIEHGDWLALNRSHLLVTILSRINSHILIKSRTKIEILVYWKTIKNACYSNSVMIFLLFTLFAFFMYTSVQAIEDSELKKEVNRFSDSLLFDKKGVPYYNYSYAGHNSIGLQGSPHAVSNHALTLYKQYLRTSNETAKGYFINNVDWLVNTNMLKNNGSFLTYEFSFPWRNGAYTIEPPWRNGMVNGEALSPLVKAYQLTGNKTYLDTAKRILNSFYIKVQDGGVTYKTPTSGWWYEEYASRNSTKEPRVLNGMIYAILGINEYYKDTNDTSARYLFDQGVLALKNDLPKYDYNGTSYYDRLGFAANPFYQSLHVYQLGKLYILTHDPIFKFYHDKWKN